MPLFQTSRFTAGFKAEAQKSDAHIIPVMEIDLPSGTRYWAPMEAGGVLSDARGLYEPRLQSVGKIKTAIAGRRNELPSLDTSVVIDDTDLLWSKVLGRLENVQDAPARIYLASKNLAFADWFPAYTGRLFDWRHDGEATWALYLRPNDVQLRGDLRMPVVTRYDWPDAPEDSINKQFPIIYGVCDAQGERLGGSCPAIYVDNVGFRYLVSWGWTDPYNVYVGPTRQTLGGSYTVSHVRVKGKPVTLLDFSGDQGTTAVTCDVRGYESVGDGTGTMLRWPGECFKHFLLNFVFNEYLGGNWVTSVSGTPVHATAWDDLDTNVFKETSTNTGPAGGRGYHCGRHIGAATTGLLELNAWALSHGVYPYWTEKGELAVKPDLFAVGTDSTETTYLSDPWLRYPGDFLRDDGATEGDMVPEFRADESLSRLIVNYFRIPALDKYQAQLEVADPMSKVDAVDSIDLLWGPHFA